MWQTNDETPGIAVWEDRYGNWSLDASSGKILVGYSDAAAPASPIRSWLSFEPVEPAPWGLVSEQFVRGDELHLYFPQGEGLHSLRLTVQPVRSTPENLIVEWTVAIQTDLLDSHPTLDMVVPGKDFRAIEIEELKGRGGTAPIHLCRSSDTVAVLLGQHDAPFTTDRSSESGVRLRLFGDFLEKGVIRKARPWMVIDRGNEIGDPQLRRIWRELADSPLPLTP